MNLSVVQDWGGFEQLVAELHKTGGDIRVERNVVLTGKSGAARQIDVLLRQKVGLYETTIVIECKHWNHRVKRIHVENVAATVADLNAARGVVFTTKGFQSGAIVFARSAGIDLFKLRELTNAEWGAPGKDVDFYIQYYYRTIRFAKFTESDLGRPPLILNLAIGNGSVSRTEISHSNSSLTGETVEELIDSAIDKSFGEFLNRKAFLINNGEDCTRYLSLDVNIEFRRAAIIKQGGVDHIVSKISFELGIKCMQMHLTIDRSLHYDHALIIQNCITETLFTASRIKGKAVSQIRQIEPASEAKRAETDKFVNGSIMRVALKSWFDPK